MRLNEVHPMNEGVLRHLRGHAGSGRRVYPIFIPVQSSDPYVDIDGHHPDIVERVWYTLESSLPLPVERTVAGEGFVIQKMFNSRALVYGTPALVHPIEGIILAFCYGTAYIIRVPAESLNEALEAGCKTEKVWSLGEKTNLKSELGEDWVFGCWSDDEKKWLKGVYQQCTINS
jgi:hypothetical protein